MNLQQAFNLLSSEKVLKLNEVGAGPFLGLFLAVIFVAFFLIYLYQYFYGHKSTGSQLYRSFPLLLIAITGIFLGLQFSIPLSLGLLGALSIVRFRTPVKEAEEVAFVLILISLSLCFATFNFKFAGYILIFTVIALFILNRSKLPFLKKKMGGAILLTLPMDTFNIKKEMIFKSYQKLGDNFVLDGLVTSKDHASISYQFMTLDQKLMTDIIDDMTQIDSGIHCNIFYHKSPFF
jgi:hypothetical protein